MVKGYSTIVPCLYLKPENIRIGKKQKAVIFSPIKR